MKLTTDGCPYGIPGDRLWVREAWAPLSTFDPTELGYLYRADHHKGLEKKDGDQKWKPSIHMPRAASRITLEITGLKVERLQKISEADAIAEGIESQPQSHGKGVDWKYYGWLEKYNQWSTCPIRSYESLWTSINGPDSWSQNPYVWVIQFKRIAQPS